MTTSRSMHRVLVATIVSVVGVALSVSGQTTDPPATAAATNPAAAPAPTENPSPNDSTTTTERAVLGEWVNSRLNHVDLVYANNTVDLERKTAAHVLAGRYHADAIWSLEQCQQCHQVDAKIRHPVAAFFSAVSDGPWVGVAVAPADDVLRAQLKLPEGAGVVVTQVVDDSPAKRAGVEEHDILICLDDQPVATPEDLDRLLKAAKPDVPVRLRLVRAGAEVEKDVTPQKRAADALVMEAFHGVALAAPAFRIGVSLADPDPTLRRQLKLGETGVVVIGVESGSAAEERGVKVNDVIVSANGSALANSEGLMQHVQDAGDQKPLELSLLRGGVPIKIQVTPRKAESPLLNTVSLDFTRAADQLNQEVVVVRPGVVNTYDRQFVSGLIAAGDVVKTPATAQGPLLDRLQRVTSEIDRLRTELESVRAELARQQEHTPQSGQSGPSASETPAPTGSTPGTR